MDDPRCAAMVHRRGPDQHCRRPRWKIGDMVLEGTGMFPAFAAYCLFHCRQFHGYRAWGGGARGPRAAC